MTAPTRPTTTLEWATDAAADRREPTAGKKLLGWKSKERPPGQTLNWWQRLTGDWVDWLDYKDQKSEIISIQAASGGVVIGGFNRASSGTAYIKSSGGGPWIWQWSPEILVGQVVEQVHVQRYGDGAADFTITVYQVDASGVMTSIGTATVTNPPASWASSPVTVTMSALAAGESVIIDITANAANIQISTVTCTRNYPA